MSGQRSKEATAERADKALEHYAKRYQEWHGNPAPMMRYEKNGWVAVSCRSDRMMFPTNRRIKDIEADTRALEMRLKYRSPR